MCFAQHTRKSSLSFPHPGRVNPLSYPYTRIGLRYSYLHKLFSAAGLLELASAVPSLKWKGTIKNGSRQRFLSKDWCIGLPVHAGLNVESGFCSLAGCIITVWLDQLQVILFCLLV